MKQAGIREVARAAGVSISTVSRAFTRPELVTEKTRQKVRDAAAKLDFNISRSATSLKTGQTYRVALLMNEEITSWFNTQVFAGINSIMHNAGYDISIFEHIDTAENRESFFTNLPILRNVDAVFVASFGIDPYQAEQLRRIHVPIIGINVPSSSGFDASISIDDEAGMYEATKYLIDLGHRYIVFPCSQCEPGINSSIDRREQGFLRACAEANANRKHAEYQVRGEVLAVARGKAFADNALEALLQLPDFPDAICCEMDMIAIPLLLKLREHGYQAPQDYSITGFDDSPYADTVNLTTVHQDPFSMGQCAAKKAMRLIDTNSADSDHCNEPTHEILVPKLIERSSVRAHNIS